MKPEVIKFIEEVTMKECIPVPKEQLGWAAKDRALLDTYFSAIPLSTVRIKAPTLWLDGVSHPVEAVGVLLGIAGDIVTCDCVIQSKGLFYPVSEEEEVSVAGVLLKTRPGPLEAPLGMKAPELWHFHEALLHTAMFWGIIRTFLMTQPITGRLLSYQ
jgi:hypothetical protein